MLVIKRISCSLFIGLTLVAAQYNYPPTPVETVVDELHGKRIADDYRWLEDRDNPATMEWIAAQTAFTRSILDTLPSRERITNILRDFYDMPEMTVPNQYGQRYFYFRRSADQDRPVLYYTDQRPGLAEQVALDPTEFSTDGSTSLDWHYPSPSGALLAYGLSIGGSEISTLRIRDVDEGTDARLEIPYTRSGSVVWLPDESGFYYVRYPEPGTVPEGDEFYFRRLFFHDLADTAWRQDKLIFGDQLGREDWVSAYASSDGNYLFIYSSLDWAVNDLYFAPIDRPDEIQPLAVGMDGSFTADVFDQQFYLLTNFQAPRYRILTTPVRDPKPDNWHEVIPETDARLEKFVIIDGQLAVTATEDVVSHLWIYSLDGRRKWEVPMPAMGAISKISGSQRSYDLFFEFESYNYPPTIYQFDFFTDRLNIIEQPRSPVDLSKVAVKQVFYPGLDGTPIPMFIIHPTDLEFNGDQPTALYGYGGFDISLTPGFSRRILPWVTSGGVYAIANIRGGGEYGREWHEAARLENKQVSYDDFIAAGDWLVANGYTNPSRLACLGGSNGGLLVGAAITQRPDLWQAALCAVPLLDMLRYHQFSIASLWIPEFGSAENPDQFDFIYAYSPYHNVKSFTDYPATIYTTSEYDTRVDPLHACKMTALMQKKTSSDRPVVLRYEQQTGHTGKSKAVSQKIATLVDELSFLMWQVGLE